MSLFLVAIILAMCATVVAMILGLLSMSGGGATDREFSGKLMWLRIGLQALTLLLLGVAALAR